MFSIFSYKLNCTFIEVKEVYLNVLRSQKGLDKPMSAQQKLLKRQRDLKKKISAALDILMGSVVKSPSQSGFYLTDKLDGKTVTRYLRKSIRREAQDMTKNHRKVRGLLRQISAVNFEILKRKAE